MNYSSLNILSHCPHAPIPNLNLNRQFVLDTNTAQATVTDNNSVAPNTNTVNSVGKPFDRSTDIQVAVQDWGTVNPTQVAPSFVPSLGGRQPASAHNYSIHGTAHTHGVSAEEDDFSDFQSASNETQGGSHGVGDRGHRPPPAPTGHRPNGPPLPVGLPPTYYPADGLPAYTPYATTKVVREVVESLWDEEKEDKYSVLRDVTSSLEAMVTGE